MRRIWLAWLLAVVGFGAWLLPAAAQGGQAPVLTGQVTGLHGYSLAGIDIEVFRYGTGRVASVVTDEEGYFRYQAPDDASIYWVRVWAKGYRVKEGNWLPGQGSPFMALALEPMETDLAFRAIDPRTGSGVTGSHFEMRREGGRVVLVDGDDSGVANVRVASGDGYSVLAWAPGRIPVLQDLGTLKAGAAQSVILNLQASTGVIKGTVADPSGLPLQDVKVRVVRDRAGVVAVAQTDRKGNFSVTVPAGSHYQVLAALDGYTAVSTDWFALAAGEGHDLSGGRQIVMRPATAGITGRLRDPEGRPLSGRIVWLYRKSVGAIASTSTDAEGKFAFDGLPAVPDMEYQVQVLPGDSSWRAVSSPWFQLTGGQTMITALRIQRGTLGNRTPNGSIVGTVLDEWGLAVPAARVELWREGSGFVQSATSATDGSFSFATVAANGGAHVWEVPYNGYFLKATAPDMREATSAAEGMIDIVPGSDTAVTVKMHHRWLPLAGQVVDDHGLPVANAEVVLTPASGTSTIVFADREGRWRVDQTDPLVDYTLSASHSGHYEQVMPDPVHSGPNPGNTVIQLRPATAKITGNLARVTGDPAEGFALDLWSPTGGYQAVSGSDGWYTVEVPTGYPYIVSVASSGDWATASSLVQLNGGEAQQSDRAQAPGIGEGRTISFQLSSGVGAITGTVLGSDGHPVPYLSVELVREGQGVVTSTATDLRGRYRFNNVPANSRYEVRTGGGQYSYVGSGLPRLFTVMPDTISNVHIQVPMNL